MSDLKKVYQAINEDEALNSLLEFREKWQQTYPSCVKSWEENWDILSMFFAYPAEVRKIIYTTNIIEGLNRQFRKITKNKQSFTNGDSLRKILYLVSKNIAAHWSVTCRNWDLVSNQLSIMFADRKSQITLALQATYCMIGFAFTQNFMKCPFFVALNCEIVTK